MIANNFFKNFVKKLNSINLKNKTKNGKQETNIPYYLNPELKLVFLKVVKISKEDQILIFFHHKIKLKIIRN